MSEFKGTPGPWFEYREGFSTVYVEAKLRDGVIQEVAACGPTEAGQEAQSANARLIAAAPELLEALQDMLSGWKYIRQTHGDMYGVGWDRSEQKATEAIAKALGQQPLQEREDGK